MNKQLAMTWMRTLFLVASAALVLMPILLTVVNSFMTEREIHANYDMLGKSSARETVNVKWIPDWVSLGQYGQVLIHSSQYLRMFWNSVFMVAPIVIGQAAVALLASFAFAKLRFPCKEPLFLMYLITMLMPFQVTLVPNYLMSDWLGLLNTPASIICPGIFGAFGVFLLRQFMSQIPAAYMEAARIDGAGVPRIFASIAVPMVKPGIAALVVLLFADYWNMVEQPLVFLHDDELQPLSVMLSRVQNETLGVMFSASVLYMSPMLLLFFWMEKYFIEGIELSGIKG